MSEQNINIWNRGRIGKATSASLWMQTRQNGGPDAGPHSAHGHPCGPHLLRAFLGFSAWFSTSPRTQAFVVIQSAWRRAAWISLYSSASAGITNTAFLHSVPFSYSEMAFSNDTLKLLSLFPSTFSFQNLTKWVVLKKRQSLPFQF